MIVHVYKVISNYFVKQAIIEDFYSLVWAERFYELGDFELELPIEYAEEEYIADNYYIRIPDSNVVMEIEEVKPYTEEDKSTLLVKGRSVECALGKRVFTVPIAVDDVAETIIYSLIDENLTSPSDSKRRIYLFKQTFPTVSTTATFAGLFEQDKTIQAAVLEICKATGLGLKAEPTSDNQMSFLVYEGVDRSFDQSTNPYVIFSEQFDNILESSFYESVKGTFNVVYVYTNDSVYDLVEVWAAGESEPQYAPRREGSLEMSIDRDVTDPPLSDAEVLAIINTRGRAEIEENKVVGMFEGEFDIQGNFKYGTDFFMGDIVQCNIQGRNAKSRIIELVRSFSTDGETSYVAMDFII